MTLALTSQINSLWAWLLLNGVVTIGCAMLGNLVINVTLSKWFVERRGIVISVTAMGVSFGGVVLTPLATWLGGYGWLARGLGFGLGWVRPHLRCPWHWLCDARLRTVSFTRTATRRLRSNRVWASRHDWSWQRLSPRRKPCARSRSTRWSLPLVFDQYFVLLIHTVPFLSDSGLTRNRQLSLSGGLGTPMVSKPFWGCWIDRTPVSRWPRLITGIALLLIVYATALELFWIYAAYAVLGLGWGGMIPMQEVIWAAFCGRKFSWLHAVRPLPWR